MILFSSYTRIPWLLPRANLKFHFSSHSTPPTSVSSNHHFIPHTNNRKIHKELFPLDTGKPSWSDGIPYTIATICTPCFMEIRQRFQLQTRRPLWLEHLSFNFPDIYYFEGVHQCFLRRNVAFSPTQSTSEWLPVSVLGRRLSMWSSSSHLTLLVGRIR